jgi:hypothetical protein
VRCATTGVIDAVHRTDTSFLLPDAPVNPGASVGDSPDQEHGACPPRRRLDGGRRASSSLGAAGSECGRGRSRAPFPHCRTVSLR